MVIHIPGGDRRISEASTQCAIPACFPASILEDFEIIRVVGVGDLKLSKLPGLTTGGFKCVSQQIKKARIMMYNHGNDDINSH